MKGDYKYHGLQFEFTLNEQAESTEQNEKRKRKKFRGRIKVISLITGRLTAVRSCRSPLSCFSRVMRHFAISFRKRN